MLIMVAYHTLNYFRYDVRILRHLHFLPTSFIFIAGFLITHIYLPQTRAPDTRVYRRLFGRAVKTLVLFIALNLVVHTLFRTSYNRHLGLGVLAANLEAVFVTGDQRAAVFGVLLPIAYLLLLSVGLLRVARVVPLSLPLVAGTVFVTCATLAWHGRLTFNLDLVSMGLLGMAAGLLGQTRLERLTQPLPAMAFAYVAYSLAIHVWYPTYLINTIGVGLSLLLLYAVGRRLAIGRWAVDQVTLLGNYSLFSYLVQIAVLQALFRLNRGAGWLDGAVLGPLAVTVIATLAAAQGMDAARRRSVRVDRAYRLVFA